MKKMSYGEAIREGMSIRMRENPNVLLFGEDVGAFGGCFGVTAGLFDEFGEKRVRDTPISEWAIEEWKLNEGDVVKKGDVLFSVATDKLTNDVEAEADGVLLKILISAGETAPCKAVAAYVGAAGEAVADNQLAASASASSEAVDAALSKGTEAAPSASAKASAPSPVKTSPMASKLADELGVDVKHLEAVGITDAITDTTHADGLPEESNNLEPVKVNTLRRSIADNMLTHHRHVNMGLAVAKGDGLIVPNVKCADIKSLSEIARETQMLVENTRSGKILLEDMTGGTFTITSLGPYGITTFSPIINQPELAIFGVGDIVDTPVVRDGQIIILPMMNLNLTADHRVIDGVMASKFLGRICELLENPYLLLA